MVINLVVVVGRSYENVDGSGSSHLHTHTMSTLDRSSNGGENVYSRINDTCKLTHPPPIYSLSHPSSLGLVMLVQLNKTEL